MQKNTALTLLELLAILAITTTLVLMAIPFLQRQIAELRAQRIMTQISNLIYAARQQAIHRAQAITICPLNTNKVCDADWQQGFSVFLDPEQQYKLTTPTNLLKKFHLDGQQGYLTWSGFSQSRLTIQADGAMLYHNGTFTYYSNYVPAVVKKIIIGPGGRLR